MPNYRPSINEEVQQDGVTVVPFAKKLNFIGAEVTADGLTANITVGGSAGETIVSRQFNSNTSADLEQWFVLPPTAVVKEVWAIIDQAFNNPIGMNVAAFAGGVNNEVENNLNDQANQHLNNTGSGGQNVIAQTFTTTSINPLEFARWNLSNPNNVPSGTLVSQIRAVTPITLVPTGPILAESDPIDVSTIPSTPGVYTPMYFTFPTPFVPLNATQYAVQLFWKSTETQDFILFGATNVSDPIPGVQLLFDSTDSGATYNIIAFGWTATFAVGQLTGGAGDLISNTYFADANDMDFTLTTRFSQTPNQLPAPGNGIFVATQLDPNELGYSEGAGRIFLSYYNEDNT